MEKSRTIHIYRTVIFETQFVLFQPHRILKNRRITDTVCSYVIQPFIGIL